MVQTVATYEGYGVDLGALKPKFSENKEKQKSCQDIYDDMVIGSVDLFDDELLNCLNDVANGNVDIYTCGDSDTFYLLLIIENQYNVLSSDVASVSVFTKRQANEMLVDAFKAAFNRWNKLTKQANAKQTDLIENAVTKEIIKNANYDTINGPWYDIY